MEYYLEQPLKSASRRTQILFYYPAIYLEWTMADRWSDGYPWTGPDPQTPKEALSVLSHAEKHIGRWYGDPNGVCRLLAQAKQRVLDDWDGLTV